MWRGIQTPPPSFPQIDIGTAVFRVRWSSTGKQPRGAIQGAYMALAVRNEGGKVNSNINVTPMVDVMLVLLIIFMVITPMVQNKVAITLPQTLTPEVMPDADKEDAIVVAVTRDGHTYLGAEQVSLD